MFLPLSGREDDLNRIPGYRVRRFFIERHGMLGRLHFLDGTPTSIVFEIGRDEPRVLNWVGLPAMEDGETLWFDIAAMPVEAAMSFSSSLPHPPGGGRSFLIPLSAND